MLSSDSDSQRPIVASVLMVRRACPRPEVGSLVVEVYQARHLQCCMHCRHVQMHRIICLKLCRVGHAEYRISLLPSIDISVFCIAH